MIPEWLGVLILLALIPISGGVLWLIYGSRWGINGPSKEPKIESAPVSAKPAPTVVFGSNEDGQFELKWSDGSCNAAALLWLPMRFTRAQSRAFAESIIRHQGGDSPQSSVSSAHPDPGMVTGDDPPPPGAEDPRARTIETIRALILDDARMMQLVFEGAIPWSLARAVRWNFTHVDIGEEPNWNEVMPDEPMGPNRATSKDAIVTPYNGPANDGSKS